MSTSADAANTRKEWPWHPLIAVVLSLAVFMAAQVVGAFGVQLLAAALKSAGHPLGQVWEQFMFVCVAEGLTLAGLASILRSKGKTFRSLGLLRPQWRDIGYTVVSFVVYFSLYVTLLLLVKGLVPSLDLDQKQDIGFDNVHGAVALLPVFISLVICAPFTEELLFRGFVLQSLRARYRWLISAVVTSLIFGAAHLLGGEQGSPLLWVAGIDTFVLSIVLCYVREKTGRLWAGMGLHALKNSVAFVLLFIVSR